MTKTLTLLALVCTLAGCSAEKVETVAWYKAHDAERKVALDRCKKDGDKAASSQNCLNADRAESETQRARRGFLKLPTVDQSTKGGARG